MKLFHENPIFETVKSKVIISLFETVRLSVSISPRNLYNSLKSIKEISILVMMSPYTSAEHVYDRSTGRSVSVHCVITSSASPAVQGSAAGCMRGQGVHR